MLDFNLGERLTTIQGFLRQFARDVLRPTSIEYDRREHEKPIEVLRQVNELMQTGMLAYRKPPQPGEEAPNLTAGGMGSERSRGLTGVTLGEEVGYGAASLVLSFPGPGLAGAAILATGTQQQKDKWLARYNDDQIRWGAMAVTEPGCGSDVGAIKATAVREKDHWILNGRKIFCTNGASADIVVVWATIDASKGKEGIRAFIVEKGTEGFSVGRLEKKLGIRSSETAELVLENCRVPLDAMLGEEARSPADGPAKGFKGVMATFDSTRPGVAALAIGIARASFEYLQERLAEEGYVAAPYGRARTNMTAVDEALIELEAQIEAARLLTHRAAWMIDQKIPNALEASMAKAKAGKVVVDVCAKAVELLGPEGVTRKHPSEMWLRDSKVFDIFEGTGQINRLVIARRILGYSSKELS
jgi:acyl-CoA dehydrogenase